MVRQQLPGPLLRDAFEDRLKVVERVERLPDELGLLAVLHVSAGREREQRQRVVFGQLLRRFAAADGDPETLLGEQ